MLNISRGQKSGLIAAASSAALLLTATNLSPASAQQVADARSTSPACSQLDDQQTREICERRLIETRRAASEELKAACAKYANGTTTAERGAEIDCLIKEMDRQGAEADRRAEQYRKEAEQYRREGADADRRGAEADRRTAKADVVIACGQFLTDEIAANKLSQQTMLKTAGGVVTEKNVCAVAKAHGYVGPKAESKALKLN